MLKRIFNADAIFGYIMIAISAGFYIMSEISFQGQTVDGGIAEGYVPKMLAIIITIFAVYIIADSIIKNRHYFVIDKEHREGVRMMVIILIMLAAYVALWPFVHFVIQTLALLVGMCYVLKMSKKFTLIFSVVFSLVIYFLFANVFHILL